MSDTISPAMRRPSLTRNRVEGIRDLRKFVDRTRFDGRKAGPLYRLGDTADERRRIRAALDYLDQLIEWSDGRVSNAEGAA